MKFAECHAVVNCNFVNVAADDRNERRASAPGVEGAAKVSAKSSSPEANNLHA